MKSFFLEVLIVTTYLASGILSAYILQQFLFYLFPWLECAFYDCPVL